MKIALPVNNNHLDAGISHAFGRAPFFLFYDTETGEEEYVSNRSVGAPGGAGVSAAQQLADSGIEVVLSPRCGQNAAQVLMAANIAVYVAEEESIQQSIDSFTRGELKPLVPGQPGVNKFRRP